MLNAASSGRPDSSTQPRDGKSEPMSRVICAMALRLTLPPVQSSEITKRVVLDSLNDRLWVTIGHALFSRFYNRPRFGESGYALWRYVSYTYLDGQWFQLGGYLL
jgi:hypothetical protein